MEAKDTVMGDNIRATIMANTSTFETLSLRIAEEQAEISFKAGQKEPLSKDGLIIEMRREYEEKLNLKKRAGIREVLSYRARDEDPMECLICLNVPLAKLKEWGI